MTQELDAFDVEQEPAEKKRRLVFGRSILHTGIVIKDSASQETLVYKVPKLSDTLNLLLVLEGLRRVVGIPAKVEGQSNLETYKQAFDSWVTKSDEEVSKMFVEYSKPKAGSRAKKGLFTPVELEVLAKITYDNGYIEEASVEALQEFLADLTWNDQQALKSSKDFYLAMADRLEE